MVLANISCDLDLKVMTPKVKVKGQIMYFLVNALSPKPLYEEATNFAAA